jgi:predicted acetyltransferase
MHKLLTVDPSPIHPDELGALLHNVDGAFHRTVSAEGRVERMAKILEPARTLVIRDRGRVVASAGIYSRHLTVPGAVVPVAAVTQVGVQPTHRRRGMLTSLMRRQLADVHDGGREAIAALWASEAAIYGRFGYGPAAWVGNLDIASRDAVLRVPTDLRVELQEPAEAIPAMRAVHDAVRPGRPGMLDRGDPWWERAVRPEDGGEGPLRAAVIEGVAYAIYDVKPAYEHERPNGEARVRELVATSPAGHAAIWRFLLELDLTRRIRWWLAPVDDPLPHMIGEARAVRTTVSDGIWLRVVDLPRALSERTYGEPFEVVLEVADDVCPWNAGRWALHWDGTAATCARTSLPAALALGVADVGAAYLGGTTLEVLARAGRVDELRAGALSRVSRSFAGTRAPWCPEIF